MSHGMVYETTRLENCSKYWKFKINTKQMVNRARKTTELKGFNVMSEDILKMVTKGVGYWT